jgi:hypothetical protein
MMCPNCGVLTLKLALVECRTGNANKRQCPKCRCFFYEQADFGLEIPTPPLAQTLTRLARVAVGSGLVLDGDPAGSASRPTPPLRVTLERLAQQAASAS